MKLTAEQEAKLLKAIQLSKSNLVAFRHLMLTNGTDEVNPPEFHFHWSDILLKEKDNFAIEGFRESGKGQIVLRAFPLYALRFPAVERDYIVLIKQNSTLAGQKLLEIENEYTTNPALNTNIVKVNQKSTSIFDLDVKDAQGVIHNIRIEAYGKGASIRGLSNIDRRPKIVIIDDPQDLEDSQSDTILDKDWQWFVSDVMFLGQHTRIFLIGNNLGEKCIVERVFNAAQELNFQTRKIAILNEQGEPAWIEKFSLADIEKQKEAFRRVGQIDVWMRERMCEATSVESRVFDKNDFIRYSYLYVDKIIRGHNLFVTVDPASSVNKGACYRAICVNAVSEQNMWTLVDFPYGRWKSDEFIEQLFKVVEKWTPYLGGVRRLPVGIEKGHFKQILEPFIYKEMQRRQVYFDIVPIEHSSVGTKLERVKMLAPLFKAHMIQLPENSPWLAELEAELMGVTNEGFKSLFVDLIDALAMQQQIAKPSIKGRIDRQGGIEQVTGYNPLEGRVIRQRESVGTYDPLNA